MDWDVKCRKCERKLRELVKQDPSVGTLVQEIMEAQKVAKHESSAVEMYHLVLYNRPNLAPAGYWEYASQNYGWVPPTSEQDKSLTGQAKIGLAST
jgi:hypothetical protein